MNMTTKTTAKIYNFAKIFKDGTEWLVCQRKQDEETGEWYWGFHSMHFNPKDAKSEFRRLVLSPQLQ